MINENTTKQQVEDIFRKHGIIGSYNAKYDESLKDIYRAIIFLAGKIDELNEREAEKGTSHVHFCQKDEERKEVENG